MNIFTVRDNLKNTILGKKLLLATYENPEVAPYSDLIRSVMIQVLKTNIDELTKILEDVEISCKESRKVAFKALKLELLLNTKKDVLAEEQTTVEQLREAISKAPHGRHCAFTTCPECHHFYSSGTGCGACSTGYERPKPCNCWKKEYNNKNGE
jgi:hypothetical protein